MSTFSQNPPRELTRREQLIAILRHGGAMTDEIAERAVDLAIAEAGAEQAAEIRRLRAEAAEQRERALDALNRSLKDGREVCADCDKPVPDGPCGAHSPDAVYQRACQQSARLRAERDQARARVAELERPGLEAKRNEIRSSYTQLISQAEQDRDFEGAATLTVQLRKSEEKWATEDAKGGAR